MNADDAWARASALDDAPGVLYAKVRLALWSGRTDELFYLLSSVDVTDELVVSAVRSACAHGATMEHARLAQRLTAVGVPELRRIGLWLSGDISAVPGEEWAQLGQLGPEVLGDSFPWALGDLGAAVHASLLEPWLESDRPDHQLAASLAYLRLDRAAARRHLLMYARAGHLQALALVCEPAEQSRLFGLIQRCTSDDSTCLALGLLGTVPAIEGLLECLTEARLAPASARALHLITGREQLADRELVTLTPDAELTEEELAARRAGDAEVGVERERSRSFTHDPAFWRAACSQHTARFKLEQRARLGLVLGGAGDAAVLAHPLLAPSVKDLCAQQIFLRMPAQIRPRSDMRVSDQQELAAQILANARAD